MQNLRLSSNPRQLPYTAYTGQDLWTSLQIGFWGVTFTRSNTVLQVGASPQELGPDIAKLNRRTLLYARVHVVCGCPHGCRDPVCGTSCPMQDSLHVWKFQCWASIATMLWNAYIAAI
jgi:hypothetical protein